MENRESIKSVLLVKLSSLGDVVNATATLNVLRQHLPRATITWAVERQYADLLREHPGVDRLIEVKSLRGKWRQFKQIRGALSNLPSFDLALDMQGTWRSAVWVYLSRARIQAGLGSFRPGWRVRVSNRTDRHAIENHSAILEELKLETAYLQPRLVCSQQADQNVARILAQLGLPASGFVALNPFSRWQSKEWPVERWVELGRRLQADLKQRVVLTGSGAERERARRLLNLARREQFASLVGEVSLGEAMCLYRRARVMVTGDTGPMHVAAALGTPLVALFGPTWPEHSGPWGQPQSILQAQRPTCHHAYRTIKNCAGLQALAVHDVFAAVKRRIETSDRR